MKNPSKTSKIKPHSLVGLVNIRVIKAVGFSDQSEEIFDSFFQDGQIKGLRSDLDAWLNKAKLIVPLQDRHRFKIGAHLDEIMKQ
jgi:hypothetical protein